MSMNEAIAQMSTETEQELIPELILARIDTSSSANPFMPMPRKCEDVGVTRYFDSPIIDLLGAIYTMIERLSAELRRISKQLSCSTAVIVNEHLGKLLKRLDALYVLLVKHELLVSFRVDVLFMVSAVKRSMVDLMDL